MPLLSGCGGIAPSVALPTIAAAPPVAERTPAYAPRRELSLQALRAQSAKDQRLADTAFRIAAANAELCPDRAPLTGVSLHTLAQYGPEARTLLAADFPIQGPGVLAVARTSPADQAGLRAGDVLISVDGRRFAPGSRGGSARYGDTQAAVDLLGSALAVGRPARLLVRRGPAQIEISLTPVQGCAYDAQVVPAAYAGASADGRHVFVTDEMIDYAASEDDLAVVVAHEYAHDLLHHRLKIDSANPARTLIGASPAAMLLAEREADYVGLYLAARAGFGVESAPAFWARLAADFPSNPFTRLTHPDSRERAGAAQAALEEIRAKRAEGAPLIPNWAGGR